MRCSNCGRPALSGSLCALCANTISADQWPHLVRDFTPSGPQGAEPGVTYDSDDLRQACSHDQGISNKIRTIQEDGPQSGSGTPGPRSLDSHAQHRHVTNRLGVAYVWNGSTLHILAIGTKHNRNTGRGDSGYDWDRRGRV